MKQKSKNCIIVGLVFILVCVCFMRIRYVNNKYPEAQLEKFDLKEPFDYEGVQLNVEESKIVNNDELKKIYPEFDEMFVDEDKKAIFVKINFKNNSDESKIIEASSFELESLSWHNGVNLELFKLINEEANSCPLVELKTGEEKTLILSYSMIERHFDKKSWNNLEDRKFYLTVDLYPVKRCVEINFS